ncbi:MAG TPA: nucleoside 2-deoxyribosyltransferase domain-containing protein [Candidatus Baltobacteraceae bacterium]|nr:nucleoside 2-deoxyribosyltransferase domain-containing protein [Candidatus Baltobacteraceae bacterium]
MPMQVVYAREPFPDRWTKSVFLAGPTPRGEGTPSWRPEALRLLEASGFDGVVFVPEDRDITGCAITPENYEPQILWEDEGLNRADIVIFWVARDLSLVPKKKPGDRDEMKMPAFTTNIEWGEYFDSGKVALGYPKETPKVGYFRTKAKWLKIPIAHTLEETVAKALEMIGDGADREDGETHVPIDVWRTGVFQRWHAAQKKAGNTLLKARVLWTYRIGRDRERLFFWALETDMRVGAEGRVFKDGIVLGRPDVSCSVLFGRDLGYNTEVVLIKEFRPSAATSDGYVHEPAGGSSWDDLTPIELAAAEAVEEAGIALTVSRLKDLGERQMMPTLSAHRAHAYVARLTAEELKKLRGLVGRPLGREREGERTWIEFHTIRGLLDQIEGTPPSEVDWSTLGMILYAFYKFV